ncbi:UvrD-helicase domain-containing protein [Flavobacterium phycosphaerae]|uniref:UvrD-helicase domain-containing protein n=2 Tax=Flavobacterium phycosphaerae TaxID=2697515 RepID=UPI00138AE97A|nr:UvrD-helicase domain-containing protein [Flavobacterium phycosphaerae]
MAEGKLIRTEIDDIIEQIDSKNNFLLSGGAGSGKTYTLVQTIRLIIGKYPTERVACITFTNAAVKEIEERIDDDNLDVSTIHDFLWDCIKNYQYELKKALVDLANNVDVKKINILNPTIEMFNENGIQYKENVSLINGIISHDELLIIAEHLFENYIKLNDIIKDKFKFILVDEYQDTNELVIKIFLKHFKKSKKVNIVGFFGDAMQSIYDNSIGSLDSYKGNSGDLVREIKKEQNRRNPLKVIDLANKLRNDGLVQKESQDLDAPNMDTTGKVKPGDIKFIYSSEYNLEKVRQYLDWDFNDAENTKELNLTHNLIAKQAQFSALMSIYNDDQILEYKNLINSFLKEHPEIIVLESDTFSDVIKKTGINPSNGNMLNFITSNQDLFNEAITYPFEVFKKIYLDSEILTDDKKQKEGEESKKGSKRDNLLKHLFKIQNCIRLYKDGFYNDFLKTTNYKINSINDKTVLKKQIEDLSNIGSKSIGEMIDLADTYKIIIKDQRLDEYIAKKQYVYNRVCKVGYTEFLNLFNYLEGYTPFSTQHKTKGNEFDNVLVILDRGNWNKYNFEYVFDNGSIYQSLIDGKSKTKSKLESYPKIKERTQKIFYVCCTRAKENLAVFFHLPSPAILSTAESWFTKDNLINLDSIT